jgi:hypothetical protein
MNSRKALGAIRYLLGNSNFARAWLAGSDAGRSRYWTDRIARLERAEAYLERRLCRNFHKSRLGR